MNLSQKLEFYRIRSGPYASSTGDNWGAFIMPGPKGADLKIIAAPGEDPVTEGWDHVSVSCKNRIPNWIEMCFVKDLFWMPEDCVVQFHIPKSNYINYHPFVLHMWRWTKGEFPRPPSILVGPNNDK